jgi:hypothetical protein
MYIIDGSTFINIWEIKYSYSKENIIYIIDSLQYLRMGILDNLSKSIKILFGYSFKID